MKKIIFALSLFSSISAFAQKIIYQESYTKDTCMVIHFHREGFEYYDFYSSPNFFGNRFHANSRIDRNKVELLGERFESFCSHEASVTYMSDKIIIKCSDPTEGVMVIKKNRDDSLSEVRVATQNKTFSCSNLKRLAKNINP